MGTNYYAFGPHNGVDGDDRSGLHIGKSSAGWQFMFRSHPHLQITSFADWLSYLTRPDVEVSDEYGAEIPLSEMVDIMSRTKYPDGKKLKDHHQYVRKPVRYVHDGRDFSTEWFC